MTSETEALIRVAVELRAEGATWESVARRVGRESATCRRWPSRYRATWEALHETGAREGVGQIPNLYRAPAAAPAKSGAAPPTAAPPQTPGTPGPGIIRFVVVMALGAAPAFSGSAAAKILRIFGGSPCRTSPK